MALHPSFRQKEVVKRTLDVLLGDTPKTHFNIIRIVQSWIREHLIDIKAEVMEWYRTRSLSDRARQRNWDSLIWEIQIAVPASWGPDAANVMTVAAREPGFDRANTREKPQCVAGACMKILSDGAYLQVSRFHTLSFHCDVLTTRTGE